MTKLRMPFIDYTNEKSTASVNVATAILDAAITAVVAAVDGLVVDGRQLAKLVTETDKDSGIVGPATAAAAQRENKWLVRATDDVNGKMVSFEIPCADVSLLTAGTDMLALAGTEAAAFVTAAEANILSVDGNAISIVSIQFVGRNL